MFSITFTLDASCLQRTYNGTIEAAHAEITCLLEVLGFAKKQNGFYIGFDDGCDLATLYEAINKLNHIDWFKKSVREIHAFKIEDWSDFTEIVSA